MPNMGSAQAASRRIAALFENRQEEPISRDEIVSVAGGQLDAMKRIRRNGGARDYLDPKGIAILWGVRDRYLIAQLGLGPVSRKEWISYKPKNQAELDMLRSHGHQPLQSLGFP